MSSDPEIAERQIEAAIWYVKHKARLRKIFLGTMLAFDILVGGYVLLRVGQDLVSLPIRRAQDAELLQNNFPQRVSDSTAHPMDLQLGGVEFLQSGQVKDVFARVHNPNLQWSVHFSYTLGMGEQVAQAVDGFLLPGEERPLFHSFRGSGGGATVFTIDKVQWRRINAHEIPDFAQFRQEHLNFETKEVQFLPAVVEGQGRVSRATFSITNKTA